MAKKREKREQRLIAESSLEGDLKSVLCKHHCAPAATTFVRE